MIRYSKKEQKQIEKAVTLAIKDLYLLWKKSTLDNIVVPVSLDDIKKYDDKYENYGWRFVIDRNELCFDNYETRLIFAKRNAVGMLGMCFPIGMPEIIFLREYETIREKVLQIVADDLNQKKANLDLASQISRKFESIVEIDVPKSQNVHEIEVSEEDGKKIGVINFGAQTVKIITEGDIVLVNKDRGIKKKAR